jgi:hypothetical protein
MVALPTSVDVQIPGFIAVMFDVPFPISVPNGSYVSYDPKKGIAVMTVTLKEGSRAFFRNTPVTGPTSFDQLRQAQQEPTRRERTVTTSPRVDCRTAAKRQHSM